MVFRKPEIAAAKIAGGVPWGSAPLTAREPTAINEMTASSVSSNMAPKDTGSMFFFNANLFGGGPGGDQAVKTGDSAASDGHEEGREHRQSVDGETGITK